MLDAGDDDDVVFASFEHPTRRGVGEMMAAALRLNRAAAEAVHLDCRVMAVEVGVEQRDVKELALAGALAMQQCRHYGQRRMHAGTYVTERRGRKVWRTICLAGHVGNPGIRLRDE